MPAGKGRILFIRIGQQNSQSGVNASLPWMRGGLAGPRGGGAGGYATFGVRMALWERAFPHSLPTCFRKGNAGGAASKWHTAGVGNPSLGLTSALRDAGRSKPLYCSLRADARLS